MRKITIALVLSLFVAMPLLAETIHVLPGDGTIATAITNAVEGDTLELEGGVYIGSFTLDKTLTIKAVNKFAKPHLFDLSISLEGGENSKTNYTFQGLTFDKVGIRIINSDNKILESLSVIENEFIDSSIYNYDTCCSRSAKIESIYMIGNYMHSHSRINDDASSSLRPSKLFVVAGNNIILDGFQSKYNFRQGVDGSFTHFIGNKVESVFSAKVYDYDFGVLQFNDMDSLNIMGNSFTVSYEDNSVVNDEYVIQINNIVNSSIQNNSFSLLSVDGLTSGSGQDTTTGLRWINYINVTSIENNNNVYDMGGFELGGYVVSDETHFGSIHFSSSPAIATIQGNIFYNSKQKNISNAPSNLNFNQNSCTITVLPCPDNNGNLNLNIDELALGLDYSLGAVSKAVDAGPMSPQYNDIDGSVNDMGIYGGSFPFDQFSIQNTPGRLEPFIYPLFNANQSVSSSTGAVRVNLLGVSRIR